MPNTDRERPVIINDGQQDIAEPAKTSEAEQKLGMSMLMKIALSVLLLSSLIISITCLMKANQLQREAEELEAEVAEYNEKIKQLNYYINEEVDDEYIAKFAREMYDMFFPDEELNYNDVND